MCNAWNHSPGCMCGWGGEGHLGRRGPDDSVDLDSREWSLTDLGGLLTHPTTCWWCGAQVYFHRDENGGCVLFEELGPPWPVHTCWEDYMRSPQILTKVESELESLGFNGSFYRPQGVRQAKPDSDATQVSISGYVADNHALYQEKRVAQLPSYRHSATIDLVTIEVSAENKLYPFLVPETYARDIPDFSFVEVRGSWQRRGRRWHLLATALRRIQPAGRRGAFVTQLVVDSACSVCGRELTLDASWGLDDEGFRECGVCGSMRRRMTRQAFLEHILAMKQIHA